MKIPQSCCSSSIDKVILGNEVIDIAKLLMFIFQCLVMTEELAYKNGCLKSTLILLKSNVHTVAVSALFIAITLASFEEKPQNLNFNNNPYDLLKNVVKLSQASGVFLAVGMCKRYRFSRPTTMT